MRRAGVLLLILAAVIAAGLFLLPDGTTEVPANARVAGAVAVVEAAPRPQSPATVGQTRERRDATGAAASVARPAVPHFALPPADAPLADIVEELRGEAARGSAQAACRLGAEILRCRTAQMSARFRPTEDELARNWAAQNVKPEEIERRTTTLLQQQAAMDAEIRRCEGVDLEALPPPARWFMQAGDRGHVRSMVEAISPQLYESRTLFRDEGLIPMYRARAARYFQAALEAGDIGVMNAWLYAARDRGSPLVAALPPAWRGPEFTYALGEVMALAHRPAGAPPPRAYVPRDLVITSAHKDEAERVFQRYFAGRSEAAANPFGPMGPTSLERFACEDAPR